jgi:hypothetical protein
LTGRTVFFAGVGNNWWSREDLEFSTRYSLSYTYRDERTPDPEKGDQFPGMRFFWRFQNRWGPRVVYENELTYNLSFEDASDYSVNMVQSLNVPMSKRLSLVVSLQWLGNNFPALENLDLVAEVLLRDPDGIPSSGDEFYETVEDGGIELKIGTVRERKKSLDTIFSTTLRITF